MGLILKEVPESDVTHDKFGGQPLPSCLQLNRTCTPFEPEPLILGAQCGFHTSSCLLTASAEGSGTANNPAKVGPTTDRCRLRFACNAAAAAAADYGIGVSGLQKQKHAENKIDMYQ